MLAIALALKLICEIALMALVGQWLVGWLAGSSRAANPVFRLLQLLAKPCMAAARGLSPQRISDRYIPGVALLLMVTMWVGAALVKISICVRIGLVHCQ